MTRRYATAAPAANSCEDTRTIMKPLTVRSRLGLPLAAAAFLAAPCGGTGRGPVRRRGRVPGRPVPVLHAGARPEPDGVPVRPRDGPDLGIRQRRPATSRRRPDGVGEPNPNAYFNRLRDYSGESTYQVKSRQSLGDRTSPPRGGRPRPRRRARPPRAGPASTRRLLPHRRGVRLAARRPRRRRPAFREGGGRVRVASRARRDSVRGARRRPRASASRNGSWWATGSGPSPR